MPKNETPDFSLPVAALFDKVDRDELLVLVEKYPEIKFLIYAPDSGNTQSLIITYMHQGCQRLCEPSNQITFLRTLFLPLLKQSILFDLGHLASLVARNGLFFSQI